MNEPGLGINPKLSTGQALVIVVIGIIIIAVITANNLPWNNPPKPSPPAEMDATEQEYSFRSAVERFLKEHLKDPDSLQIIGYGSPTPYKGDSGTGWTVYVKYRAKNSFGGYTVEEGEALIQQGSVTSWGGRQL